MAPARQAGSGRPHVASGGGSQWTRDAGRHPCPSDPNRRTDPPLVALPRGAQLARVAREAQSLSLIHI
eukprot:13450171-Alexandrium_andersonii.AAC.1